MNTLGLLGPKYTYHDLAREKFLPHLTYQYFDSFDDIFAALKSGKIKKALVAIRNTSVGPVNNNQERIKKENMQVLAKFDLPIHLYLGGHQNVSIENLKKIYSHPMAIKETQRYFSKYSHLTFIASTSTAGAIEAMENNQREHTAVIASREAILGNDLYLMDEGIEDDESNMTTFAYISI